VADILRQRSVHRRVALALEERPGRWFLPGELALRLNVPVMRVYPALYALEIAGKVQARPIEGHVSVSGGRPYEYSRIIPPPQ
jgi:hypothetical protein